MDAGERGYHVADTASDSEGRENEKAAPTHPRRVDVLGKVGEGATATKTTTAFEDVAAVNRRFPANGPHVTRALHGSIWVSNSLRKRSSYTRPALSS